MGEHLSERGLGKAPPPPHPTPPHPEVLHKRETKECAGDSCSLWGRPPAAWCGGNRPLCLAQALVNGSLRKVPPVLGPVQSLPSGYFPPPLGGVKHKQGLWSCCRLIILTKSKHKCVTWAEPWGLGEAQRVAASF